MKPHNFTRIVKKKYFLRRKKLILVGLSFSFLVLPHTFIYGEVISLKTLLTCPYKFDRKRVEVEGEVVGEVLKGNQGYWVNILSSGYNLGILVKDRELVKKIKNFGGYKQWGDIVKIKGVFYKEFPRGGERCINAEKIEILQKGRERGEVISSKKVKFSHALSIIDLVLATIYFLKQRWKRRLKV